METMKKHNFPSKIDVVYSKKATKKQLDEIIELAEKVGLSIRHLGQGYLLSFPYIGWSEDCLCHFGNTHSKHKINSFDEFKAFFFNKGTTFKQLKLNSLYTATISKTAVNVGCQTFTHYKIEELYKLSKAIRKTK